MSIRLQNRIYGSMIGCAIGDAMGAVVSYSPDTLINTPYDTNNVGIKEGYWTEPTTLILDVLVVDNDIKPPTCSFDQRKISRHIILSNAVRSSALAILYYDNFELLLIHSHALGDGVAKLWAAIMDTTLHGGHKRTILALKSYDNLYLESDMFNIFPAIESFDMDEESDLVYMREVLVAFSKTNSYVEGLKLIVNGSLCPEWTGALYGLLAGAYYGLTDIPADWMDCVKDADTLLDATEFRSPLPLPLP